MLTKRRDIYSIELRCKKNDSKYNYEISWPDCCEIDINGKKILDLMPL